MQRRPPSSSVIRQFRPRMGEKVEESFSQKNLANFAGPVSRPAGRTRHAEGLTKHGAEIELSKFLSLCVSHARRALAVVLNKNCTYDFLYSATRNHSLLKNCKQFHDTLTKRCLRLGGNVEQLCRLAEPI